ncbi:hypothetical protein [Lactobacillus helveticus]|nr:hypothetical protein [Lactobacillus helveticus]
MIEKMYGSHYSPAQVSIFLADDPPR